MSEGKSYGHPNPDLPIPKRPSNIGSSKNNDDYEGKVPVKKPPGKPPRSTNNSNKSPTRRPPPRPHDPPPRPHDLPPRDGSSSPRAVRRSPPARGPRGISFSPKRGSPTGKPPINRARRRPPGRGPRKGPPVADSTSEIISFAQKHAQRIQSRPRYKPPSEPPPPVNGSGSYSTRRGSVHQDKPPPPSGPPPKQRAKRSQPDPRRRPSGPPPGHHSQARQEYEQFGRKVGEEHGIVSESWGRGGEGRSGKGTPPPRGRPPRGERMSMSPNVSSPNSKSLAALPGKRGTKLTSDTLSAENEGKVSTSSSSSSPEMNRDRKPKNVGLKGTPLPTTMVSSSKISDDTTNDTISVKDISHDDSRKLDDVTKVAPPKDEPPKRVIKKKKPRFGGLKLTLEHSDAIKTPRPIVDEGKSSAESSPATSNNESKSSSAKKKKKKNRLGLTLVVEDSNHEPDASPKNSPSLSVNTGGSPDQLKNTFDGGNGHEEYGMSDSGTFAIEGFLIRPNGIAFAPGDNRQSPGFGRSGASTKTNEGKEQMVEEGSASAEDELLRLCVLGKGAGGIVYKAVHVPSLRIVAIKKIAVFDKDKRHQMVRELKALYKNLVPIAGAGSSTARGSIREGPCPYIVAFHDAFITPSEGNISIVLEYMDGGSLQDIVDTGGCNLESVLANISYRFLLGINFIHSHHQLHRDIKPSNLLINHHGAVKISDFGIVREMDGTQAKASTFVGTLTYMSPERISGEEYSYASDIWSFGLSLFTVAIGKYPLQTEGGYWGLLHTLRDEPSPKLPESDFSSVFRDFLDQCLHKDPKERPSAEQLLRHPFLEGCEEQLETSENERKYQRQRDMMGEGCEDEDDDEDLGSDTARSELDEICELIMDLEFDRWKKKQSNCGGSGNGKSFPRVPRSKLAALADQLGLRLKNVERRFERKWLSLVTGRLGSGRGGRGGDGGDGSGRRK